MATKNILEFARRFVDSHNHFIATSKKLPCADNTHADINPYSSAVHLFFIWVAIIFFITSALFIILTLSSAIMTAKFLAGAALLTVIVLALVCIYMFRHLRPEVNKPAVKADRHITGRAGDIGCAVDGFQAHELLLISRLDWENTFDTIPDIITVHDRDFNIIRANMSARKALKLPASGLSGAIKCYKYYHSKNSPPDNCQSCDCLRTRQPVEFEIYEPYLDSFLEIRAVPRYDNENNFLGIIHVARDITDHRRAREKSSLQFKRLNVLHSIEKSINSAMNLSSMLDHLVDQVTTQLGIDAASLLLLDKQTRLLDYVVSKGFRSDALKHTHLKLGEGNAGRAACEQNIIYLKNLGNGDMGNFIRSGLFAEEEFVSYFAVPLLAKGEIKGVLELFHRSPLEPDPDWLDFLDTIADQAATAIDKAALFDELQRSYAEISLAYDSTIEGWSHFLDMRDRETEGHSQRVAEMTLRVAHEIGVEEGDMVHIRRGALLHDIGKMGIPDSILLKPGKLTHYERQIMECHPGFALDMLRKIDYLKPATDIPYCHHERWDGKGYPRGLKGEDIPLAARIFAVVDVCDALCSDRPYREAWPRDKAMKHIESLSGINFDPRIVKAFWELEHKRSLLAY
ncbi:MAG: HD domain-containing protein [Nitrospiraceae bacterium]|nr:MAG: HD domain-containing protein [Nitrospiraceae bacterium]